MAPNMKRKRVDVLNKTAELPETKRKRLELKSDTKVLVYRYFYMAMLKLSMEYGNKGELHTDLDCGNGLVAVFHSLHNSLRKMTNGAWDMDKLLLLCTEDKYFLNRLSHLQTY